MDERTPVVGQEVLYVTGVYTDHPEWSRVGVKGKIIDVGYCEDQLAPQLTIEFTLPDGRTERDKHVCEEVDWVVFGSDPEQNLIGRVWRFLEDDELAPTRPA